MISCTQKAMLVIRSIITIKFPSFPPPPPPKQRVLEEENFVFKGRSRKTRFLCFVFNILHTCDEGLPKD